MKRDQRRQGTIGRGTRLVLLTAAALAVSGPIAAGAGAAAPTIISTGVSGITSDSAALKASINPNNKASQYHFEYGLDDCASNPCTSVPLPEGKIPNGGLPVAVKEPIAGLEPRTVYHFRVVARNGVAPAEKIEGPDQTFTTYPIPLSGLPDGRAYEQASPVDKDGGDAIGIVPQMKASPDGDAVSFSSTVGVPGGVGAQELPFYVARRSASGWSTHGVQPPASAGQLAAVLGWLPDFSEVFSSATKLGAPNTGALLAMPGSNGEAQELTPYQPKANYSFLGSADGGTEVFFESNVSLGSSPAGVGGVSNVYAWDRESGDVSLVSVDNEKQPFAGGAFGGSYDWAFGMTPTALSQGGAARHYYTQDQHAVSDGGAVFFTEAGSGQLYMRTNPTQPQSTLNGQGECEQPDKACTTHVSASQLTPPDPAGPRPAAFVGAAANGSATFFTSPEKLAPGANTGPVQPKPKIGRVDLPGKGDLLPDFLDDHRAVGMAVDSKYLYWADPVGGTIGRVELDGENANDAFIEPGPTFWEEEVETSLGSEEFETITGEPPSKPRYVAVEGDRICWTNTADGEREHGTIGCANINPSTEEAEDVEAECIAGASDPQGIALNATHIYWANAVRTNTIGRAEIDCGEAQAEYYHQRDPSIQPQGVVLTPTYVYWSGIEENTPVFSSIHRLPLEGPAESSKEEFELVDNTNLPRGIAVVGEDVYWAGQGREAIGHAIWPDAQKKPTTVEEEFIGLEGAPSGVAADGEHLYWSTNGETLPSPGNDLYRFEPNGEGGGDLSDLTPDSADQNGAEVQGVVGVSKDGSRVYFVANADLDGAGPAQAGNCTGPPRQASGRCSLYLWHNGAISFVARLKANGFKGGDMADWTPTRSGIAGGSEFQKTAFLSEGGETLLFRSEEQLSSYDNEGVAELYRYREGEPILCVSCTPSGEPPKAPPTLGSIKPSALVAASPATLASRNLSANGNRAFFETTEALVTSDTNGVGGCPTVGADLQAFPACRDVYEWEAPDEGGCSESSPPYSPANGGCLYLISTGKDDYPSFFADASADGKNVFFFTRQGLVGQDKDELLDVYDARVDGGIAAQNPVSQVPCESTEACRPPIPAPPVEGQPSSETFVGPGNEVSKPSHHKKAKKQKKHKAKKKHKKQKHHSRGRAGAERRVGR